MLGGGYNLPIKKKSTRVTVMTKATPSVRARVCFEGNFALPKVKLGFINPSFPLNGRPYSDPNHHHVSNQCTRYATNCSEPLSWSG